MKTMRVKVKRREDIRTYRVLVWSALRTSSSLCGCKGGLGWCLIEGEGGRKEGWLYQRPCRKKDKKKEIQTLSDGQLLPPKGGVRRFSCLHNFTFYEPVVQKISRVPFISTSLLPCPSNFNISSLSHSYPSPLFLPLLLPLLAEMGTRVPPVSALPRMGQSA